MRPEGNVSIPLRLIVSGGIGSGKSTVLEILAGLGMHVIEADRIGHAVLEPGGAAYGDVASMWPAVVQEGTIDRGSLATIVFNDIEQLRLLESVTHSHIAAEILGRVRAAADSDIAVELPLSSDLLGDGWTRIVVDAPAPDRRQRAIERGLGADDVSRRMDAQPSQGEWSAGADLVVDNSGSIEDLEESVVELVAKLRNRL